VLLNLAKERRAHGDVQSSCARCSSNYATNLRAHGSQMTALSPRIMTTRFFEAGLRATAPKEPARSERTAQPSQARSLIFFDALVISFGWFSNAGEIAVVREISQLDVSTNWVGGCAIATADNSSARQSRPTESRIGLQQQSAR
jgi:hypothetical protein